MANPLLDDYDSSDEEFASPVVNPYAAVGHDSILKIVERASELRMLSKKNYKQLANTSGAPPTVQQRHLWGARFKAWCRSMRHKLDHVPTGEDIHRFMDSMVQVTNSRYKSSGALSHTWFAHGVKFTIAHCQFEHASFQLTTQDGVKLDALAASLVNAGALTKEPFSERQWLGVRVVQRCVTALFRDALSDGTLSWDVLLCRAASLVLISALGRSGDVVTSSHYAGANLKKFQDYAAMTAPKAAEGVVRDTAAYGEAVYHLRYEDIKLKIVSHDDDASEVVFAADFEMKQDKGNKQTRKTKNRHVVVRSQTNSAFNVMDPIQYLLILALRFGVVEGTTMDTVLSSTRSRRDKTVQWLKPKYPVFPAFKPNGVGVLEDKPAQTSQALSSLRLAAELAGILAPVRMHDVRRGLASDVAYLPTVQRLNTVEVAEALGHTHTTTTKGVTAEYIGPNKRDMWSARLQNQSSLDETFGINMIEAPLKRRKHTATDDLKKACEENGLDYAKRGDREGAMQIIRQQDWRQTIAYTQTPFNTSRIGQIGTTDSALKDVSVNISRGKKTKEMLGVTVGPMLDPQLFNCAANVQESSPSTAAAQVAKLASPVVTHDEQPILSSSTNEEGDIASEDQQALRIVDFIHGINVESSRDLEAQMDPLFEDELDGVHVDEFLRQPPLQFIAKLSQINLIRHSQPVAQHVAIGGSRDAPSRFQIPCPNAVHGCPTQLETDEKVRLHLLHCKSTSAAAHHSSLAHQVERAAQGETWACDECEKSFSTKGALKVHQASHTWTPKTCEVEDCKVKTAFKSLASYRAHQSDAHTWKETTCPVEVCKNPTKVYKTRGSFKAHLGTHGIKGNELKQYIQKPASHGPWRALKCLVPDCKSPVLWKTRKDYRGHLYETHQLHETAEYMPF